MSVLLNLAIEPARLAFEVLVLLGTGHAAQRRLRVLAATPAGARRIARQRYPGARVTQVQTCGQPPAGSDGSD